MSPEREIILRKEQMIHEILDKVELMLRENPEELHISNPDRQYDMNYDDINFGVKLGNGYTAGIRIIRLSSSHNADPGIIAVTFNGKGYRGMEKIVYRNTYMAWRKVYKRSIAVEKAVYRYRDNKAEHDAINKLEKIVTDVDKILLEETE